MTMLPKRCDIELDRSMQHPVRRPLTLVLGLMLIVVVAHEPAAFGGFAWDDHELIVNSFSRAKSAPSLATALRAPFWVRDAQNGGRVAYYRPVTTASFALNWASTPFRPGAFHLTNILLHVAVCLAVYALATRLGAAPWTSAAAATVFGTWPRLTESVSWISGRTDVLATLFSATALAVAVGAQRPSSRALSAMLLLGALLSKETALAAVVAVVMMETVRARRLGERIGQAAARVAPAIACTAVYFALRTRALSRPGAAFSDANGAVERLRRGAEALGWNIRMLFDPLHPALLIGDALHPNRYSVFLGILGVLGLASAVTAIACMRSPERKGVAAAAVTATFIAGFAWPAFVGAAYVRYLAADRFLYMPLALALPLAAAWVSGMRRRGRVAFGVATCVAVALFVPVTRSRAEVWTDETRLWQHTVAVAPTHDVASLNLAVALRQAGRVDEAIPLFERVGRTSSSLGFQASTGLALALSDSGRPRNALGILEATAARNRFEVARVRDIRGVVLARMGDVDAALAEFRSSLNADPSYGPADSHTELATSTRGDSPPVLTGDQDEPVRNKAWRARWLTTWGALPDAARLWREVLAASTADEADRQCAASFFATRSARRNDWEQMELNPCDTTSGPHWRVR